MRHYGAENATFRGAEPTWANACVGHNGNPQILEYATGFASAANVLLDQVIKDGGINLCVDEFIYPVCFNMRHAVELFLKAAVDQIIRLADIRSVALDKFDMAGSHHLGNIWGYVKNNSLAADKRYHQIIEELDGYINDIAKIDATGQVFRYAFDRESQKHLTEIAVINVVVLKCRFNILENLLRKLNSLNEKLLEEYGWGSFTTRLSRVQLVKLATELPKRNQWTEPSFRTAKSSLQEKYKLSSRDFCRAIKIIEKRHEISCLIGATVEIPGLTFQALTVFIDLWSRMHNIENVKNPPLVNLDVFEYSNFRVDDQWIVSSIECPDALVDALHPDCFAVLSALFYFHREAPYSEVFDLLLEENRVVAANYPTKPSLYKSDASHLLSKTNALENILNSLNFLGQYEILDSVINRYGLEACRDRLLEFSEVRKIRLMESAMD